MRREEERTLLLINEELSEVSKVLQLSVSDKLDEYKGKIEDSFDTLTAKASEQSKYLQERIADLNTMKH